MITVRRATIEDKEDLKKLNQEIFLNNPQYDDDIIKDFVNTPIGDKFFRKALESKDNCCFLAIENEKLIGYVSGAPLDIPYRKSKYLEIENLGVIPSIKGKGVGKLLLDTITEFAKKNGYQKIYLNCYAKNIEALNFYKKHGYSQIDYCLEKVI